ncbi:MAG: hypothetical protein Q9222_005923 [Ikaeria aurantiellina]
MEAPLPHHFANAHPLDPSLFTSQLHHAHPSLSSQIDLDTDPFQFPSPLDHHAHLQLSARIAFDQRPPPIPPPRFQELEPSARQPEQVSNDFPRHTQAGGGQFGILTPHPQLPHQPQIHHEALGRLQNEIDLRPVAVQDGGTTEGHFSNLKIVPNPPDLDTWRKKLFDVDGTIILTEDDFQTYFPHIDNVYSHRSTQKYKRKPFVSHYWDCRMKGRPPGTAKSEDPSKKKRKRQARERDLCDVKIKITEYFPGARRILGKDAPSAPNSEVPALHDNDFFSNNQASDVMPNQQQQPRQYPFIAPNDVSMNNDTIIRFDQSSADSKRFYTIQRVNGNSSNGKSDGTAGPHKHLLEDSDRIKRNSVVRHVLKAEKEKKKSEKTYHKKATGNALATVKRHSKEHELKLYGSCFCPFVQRVWISLQYKGLDYQYIEIDPYKKPDALTAINPRGLIPALQHGEWGCYESTVLMEYLEDIDAGRPLFPPGNPKLKAQCRLWSDHVRSPRDTLTFHLLRSGKSHTLTHLHKPQINRNIIPAFYSYLQSQEPPQQLQNATKLQSEIAKLVEVAHPTGPFFLGTELSFVDVQFAPWILRMRRVLTPYRGWPVPEAGSRWKAWVDAVERDGHVRATTSGDELYLDSYERQWLENRPNTSQVASAINEGRGLP